MDLKNTKITAISLEKEDYGEDKGKWKCRVTIHGKGNYMRIEIPERHAAEIMRVIKPDILAGLIQLGEEAEAEMRKYLE